MVDRSAAIANLGPEALRLLLAGDETGARKLLRTLTRSELRALAETAETLAEMARRLVRDAWPASAP